MDRVFLEMSTLSVLFSIVSSGTLFVVVLKYFFKTKIPLQQLLLIFPFLSILWILLTISSLGHQKYKSAKLAIENTQLSQSSNGRYEVIEVDGEKYILDSSTMRSFKVSEEKTL